MRTLLIVTALVEAGAGLALLASPTLTAGLLLGGGLETPAAWTIARLGGAGLMSLGIGCWLMRDETSAVSVRALIGAMLFYNVAAAVLLAYAGIGFGLFGLALWPAVVLHVGLTGWCVACLAGPRGFPSPPAK